MKTSKRTLSTKSKIENSLFHRPQYTSGLWIETSIAPSGEHHLESPVAFQEIVHC